MQIVIELTDEQWKCVQDGTWCGTKEILNGKPLPVGHWVKVIDENGHAFYLCSVCKCGVEDSFNWCPNCGSKNTND